MAKIFISFHHKMNQQHADTVSNIIKQLGHNDISVNDGNKIENEEMKTDEGIRKEIRDCFLRDVDVTIVIVGSDSVHRKHIDWEIRSTIHKFDNKRDGAIVVVNALTNDQTWILDRELIHEHDGAYPSNRSWPENNEMTTEKFEWLPERLRNSLINNYDKESAIQEKYKHAVFPIVSYLKIKQNYKILGLAIDQAINFKRINSGKWDTNSKMRRNNNESKDRKQFDQYES